MKKLLFLLLISAASIFSEEVIEKFFTGGKSFSPRESAIFSYRGDKPVELYSVPERIHAGEMLMRVRFQREHYRLYKGLQKKSHSSATPYFSFVVPGSLRLDNASRTKFYSSASIGSDIPIIYFTEGRIHCEVVSVLYYIENGEWKTLQSEKNGDGFEAGFGTLAVTSEPQGALIFVDGVNTGLKTPNYVRRVLGGEHEVSFQLGGFSLTKVSVSVVPDTYTPVHTVLKNTAGSLRIEGYPIGASVSIDGLQVGALPMQVPSLNSGTYKVTIKSEGYAQLDTLLTINPGERKWVTGVRLKSTHGTVHIPKQLSGSWFINAEAVGFGAYSLPKGYHRIQFFDGSRNALLDTLVTVNPDDTIHPVQMVSLAQGEIEILPIPMTAEVFIDGKSYGYGPRKISLAAGEYSIHCKKEGFQTYSTRVKVTFEDTQIIKALLSEKKENLYARSTVRKKSDVRLTEAKRSLQREPVEEIDESANKPVRAIKTFAVLDISGNYVSRAEAITFGDNLRRKLSAKGVRVLSRGEVNFRLREAGYHLTSVYSRDVAEEIGEILGVDYVVWGRVMKDDNHSDSYLVTEAIEMKSGGLKRDRRSPEEIQDFQQIALNLVGNHI